MVDAATNLHFNRIPTVLMSAAHNGQPYATQVQPHETSRDRLADIVPLYKDKIQSIRPSCLSSVGQQDVRSAASLLSE